MENETKTIERYEVVFIRDGIYWNIESFVSTERHETFSYYDEKYGGLVERFIVLHALKKRTHTKKDCIDFIITLPGLYSKRIFTLTFKSKLNGKEKIYKEIVIVKENEVKVRN